MNKGIFRDEAQEENIDDIRTEKLQMKNEW